MMESSMTDQEAMEMESEVKNFIRLCVLTIASLLCCYFITAKIPKGLLRLISILPVITLLFILNFDLNTIIFGSTTFCCLAWLANFKLFLFAFDQGPLALPKQDLLCFILMACFAFKIKQNPPSKKPFNPILEVATRAIIVSMGVFSYYNYEHYFHKHFILVFFFLMYHGIRLFLDFTAIPAQLLLGFELEPQFKEPLFCTSLQDFWGHRWNLRVSDILRATVYYPTRSISIRMIGTRWASLPAVFVTFLVSGLMHEFLVCHVIREKPTWEVTLFFILQGIFVDMEIIVKKKLVETKKFRIHRAISGPLALVNIAVMATWLSYAQVERNGLYQRVVKELTMLVEFLNLRTG